MANHQDWPNEIAKGVIIQQQMRDADTGPMWNYSLPEVAASESRLAEVEAVLNAPLDDQYRRFLSFADGWSNFYQNVTLFGTRELLGGPPHDTAQAELVTLDDAGALAAAGVGLNDVTPIAASTLQEDLFLLCGAGSGKPGHILWVAGELIDDYVDFNSYYAAMIDYMILERDQLRAESGQA